MKYINKITGSPEQIFPSVQYKGDFDSSIYIGDPAGSTIKAIELDAAKNRMIINVNNEEDGTLMDTSLYANNINNAWYANIVSIPAADATEIKFSPYMKVTTSRNAFRNFASLEKISGLNLHNANELYSTFSNYGYSTNLLYDVRTVDGGGHQGDVYKEGDTCQVIIKNEYTDAAVNCEYIFSHVSRITDVSLSVAKPGSCRSAFENAANLINVELNLGSLTNGGTNRVDGMFNGAAGLVSVTGYIEGQDLVRVNNMFGSCGNLETFCGIEHLGEAFSYQSQYKNNQQLDLSMATKLDEQSVHDVVNKLGQIPADQNIDYAWVKFAPGKLQYLTAAEIASAEAKGWQILELEPDPEE